MYTIHVTWFPDIGKGPQLRAVLEERNRQLASAGIRANLQQGLFTADGAAFYTALQFDDLAALDVYRVGPVAAATASPRRSWAVASLRNGSSPTPGR